jgi:hypothetical protein
MAGPCLGCGLEITSPDGDLQLEGTTSLAWPYTAPGHTDPDGFYCDPDSNRLWMKPWNLPWGVVARNTGSGTGGYANGVGVNSVCSTTFTAVRNRRYRISGGLAVQADVATIFDPTNAAFGNRFGMLIYQPATGSWPVGSTFPSFGAGFSNFLTLQFFYENATAGDIVFTYDLRSYAVGLMNARPVANSSTHLLVEDIGPRI